MSRREISENVGEILEGTNDLICEMNQLIEEIVETAERHGLPLTNSANWDEVVIPENSSWLLISENVGEIIEDNNDLICEMNRIIEEIVETAERHGLPLTNSANWDEVAIPENSSWLLVSNLEESPKSGADRIGETPDIIVELDCKTDDEFSTASSLPSTKFENLDKPSKPMISENVGEILEGTNDLICEMNQLIEEIVETAERHGLPLTNSANWDEVVIPENSSWLLISEDIEEIKEDNNDSLHEINSIIDEIVRTAEHYGIILNNSENWIEVAMPENSSLGLVNNLESPESRADIIGEIPHTEEELDCKTVNESVTASSMPTETEKLEKVSKPMAVSSDKTSENQKEDTKQYVTMNNIKEDLKKTLKQHGLEIADFEVFKVESKNSSTLTVHNLENPQADLASDNGGSQEFHQFHQCKPTDSMSPIVQDIQQIFQKHGMTLEKGTVSALIEAGESPSSSNTEKSDDESVDFPETLSKTQNYKWYVFDGIVKESKDQLVGPSGKNPKTSKDLDGQDQDVSSSESETDE